MLIGDSPATRARGTTAIAEAGLMLAAALDPAAALAQLSDGRTPELAMVEWDGPADDALDALLSRLADMRCATLVSTSAALIDRVAAVTFGAELTQLADATGAERVDALIEAARRPASAVHDRSDAAERARLRATPAGLGRQGDGLRERTGAAELFDDAADAATLRRMLRTRRLRARFFDPELFADPAWDMLLDLAAARLEGSAVAVSSLCIAAAVPATTALRWIKTLTELGLFARVADPLDGRRVFIDLTDEALAAVRHYLAAERRLA